MTEPREFFHAIESFIGRALSYEEGKAVLELYEGGYSVQHAAHVVMTRADFARVYG